jgi:hypothetical protein
MKTYTKREVLELIQFIVSHEELENTSSVHISTAEVFLKQFDSLQIDYIEEPKYKMVFENNFIIDIDAIPNNFEGLDWKRNLEKLQATSLVFCGEKEIKPIESVKIEITKEVKEFIERNCNIERNNYGEDTYVLNSLRFKIFIE